MYEQIRLRDLPVGSRVVTPLGEALALEFKTESFVCVGGLEMSGALLVIKRSRGVYVML